MSTDVANTRNGDGLRVLLGIVSETHIERAERHLSDLGCHCLCARDAESLADLLQDDDLGAAVIDLTLGGVSMVERCQKHPRLFRDAPVLCCASRASDSLDAVVAAMKAGAQDVLLGSMDLGKLEELVADANGRSRARQSLEHSQFPANGHVNGLAASHRANGITAANGHASVRQPVLATNGCSIRQGNPASAAANDPIGNNGRRTENLDEVLIGSSGIMRSIRRTIREVASTHATIMIHGESGTGKELVALMIHRLSSCSSGPFVPVNVAAIPDGLAESLLFGHERGAFTSANRRQIGYCESAHGGTLFLDEVSEMESAIQPKLLRYLQTGMIQRIGSQSQQLVRARLITATNRNPGDLMKGGFLREDLFFRLHVVPIHVPPLRERPEDIEQLAKTFLRRAAEKHGRSVVGFTDEVLGILRDHPWPGNVRQLENIVERMVIFARGPLVTIEEVPAETQNESLEARSLAQQAESNGTHVSSGIISDANHRSGVPHLKPIQRGERAAIIEALERVDGHVVDAARILGLGQATVYRKIKQYAIPHRRKRQRSLR